MAVGYQQYTMASLIAEIAGLIDDPTNIQWTYQEIRYGCIEALRYWGALTSYWRARGTFNTTAGVPWADLSVELPALRSRTVTFNDLALEIDYHCFELPGGVAGTGLTSQFNIQSIITSIIRGRNRFVMDAGLPLTVVPAAVVSSPPQGRFFVSEDLVYLRHGYWLDTPSSAWSTLRASDAWAQDSYDPRWTLETGIPFSFSTSVTRPLEVQLAPVPTNDGQVEWLAAESDDYEQPITPTTLLGLPDEFAHAVKYAALSDLFTMDGESNDPQRADYCDRRYQQTVAIAKDHKSVARVQINNVPIGLSTLTMLDNAYPRWRMSSGVPIQAGCDLDMLAFYKVPNSILGVQCDVLASAPIPPSDSTYLQIGREFIPNIIDYVQHYLSFKLAGTEFFMNISLYDNFMSSAKDRNAIQSKQIRYMAPLYGMPGRENDAQMGASTDKAGTGANGGAPNPPVGQG
jgi:hypothetical protein